MSVPCACAQFALVGVVWCGSKERCESQLKYGCPKFSWSCAKLSKVMRSWRWLSIPWKSMLRSALFWGSGPLLRFRALAGSEGDSSGSIICTDLTEWGQLVRLHCKFTLQCSVRTHAHTDHVVFLPTRAHLSLQLKCDGYTYIYTYYA